MIESELEVRIRASWSEPSQNDDADWTNTCSLIEPVERAERIGLAIIAALAILPWLGFLWWRYGT
jgi:hypothetical protein